MSTLISIAFLILFLGAPTLALILSTRPDR